MNVWITIKLRRDGFVARPGWGSCYSYHTSNHLLYNLPCADFRKSGASGFAKRTTANGGKSNETDLQPWAFKGSTFETVESDARNLFLSSTYMRISRSLQVVPYLSGYWDNSAVTSGIRAFRPTGTGVGGGSEKKTWGRCWIFTLYKGVELW